MSGAFAGLGVSAGQAGGTEEGFQVGHQGRGGGDTEAVADAHDGGFLAGLEAEVNLGHAGV